MTYQIVLPSIYAPFTRACLGTLHPELKDNILVIDNTVNNIGVAASWNKGIERMKERNTDWIIFLSATMRFGQPGGIDLIEQLKTTELMVAEPEMGHQWHLMSIRREVIERVGLFDENFYPAYYEDSDYGQRIRYAFDHTFKWAKIFIDVSSMGNAHGITHGKVRMSPDKNINYYIKKWGGLPGQQKYLFPFNNPNNPQSYWVKE